MGEVGSVSVTPVVGAWRRGGWTPTPRALPAECPIAFTYNRLSHAVMLATPADLEDFAVGFSLAEGIIETAEEIEEIEVVQAPLGIELRMWLGAPRQERLEARRRHMAGPTGCGLCGLESLAQAVPRMRPVGTGRRFRPEAITAAVASLSAAQALHRATRGAHGAGYWTPERGLVALREDVGRHNALDKLAGALARGGITPAAATDGVVALTSRISVELVQKTVRLGAGVLAAMAVPTALAVRMAETAGLTLVGCAHEDRFDVFTHPHRIVGAP